MNKINRRTWFYDCGIFYECYTVDDFGNLVRILPNMLKFNLDRASAI